MSTKAVRFEHVLARQEKVVPHLEVMNADTLKAAARFWFGKEASKFRKAECIRALAGLSGDRERLAAGVRSLPDKQRAVLAVCKRYGGAVSGPVLLSETLTRGLVDKTTDQDMRYGRPRRDDPVSDLRAKLLLISLDGGYSDFRYSYLRYRLDYPDVAALPGVLDQLEAAAPLPWVPSSPASPPTAPFRRSAAEIALDLWTTAQALAQFGTWKTNRGGSLAKSIQNRLRKLFSWPGQDPLLPPEPEALYYELLRGVGAVLFTADQGHINLPAVERHQRSPGPVQAWHQVRAWLTIRLWQDGVGVVPDRDRYDSSVRIEPPQLHRARELLVWALCRVAHGPDHWLDLETFLVDLWSATGEETINFYWYQYSWQPKFELSREKDRIRADVPRRRAFWLDAEGSWAANAVMGTLAHLGLVERANVAPGPGRPCFRLTRVGKAVFGAPELSATDAEHDPKFLTVQPNHEVLAYLDTADASAVWPLAKMARRVSSAGERVQTFALTRESVYQALESGLGLEEIRRFLRDHSRTALPANLDQSLAEWGRRREALVLRTGVALAAYPPGRAPSVAGSPKARPVGDGFVLLPETAARNFRDGPILDHQTFGHPAWRVEEDGQVSVTTGADAVTLARLGQFADPDGERWQITAASVRRAGARGIPAEQILDWLHEHLASALPAIVETAIRNWSSPAAAFLGSLVLLQVTQPQACAMILSSRRFRPLLVGHIPPDCFIVRPEKREELERVLTELGFSIGGSYRFTVLPEGTTTGGGPDPARSGGRVRRGQQE